MKHLMLSWLDRMNHSRESTVFGPLAFILVILAVLLGDYLFTWGVQGGGPPNPLLLISGAGGGFLLLIAELRYGGGRYYVLCRRLLLCFTFPFSFTLLFFQLSQPSLVIIVWCFALLMALGFFHFIEFLVLYPVGIALGLFLGLALGESLEFSARGPDKQSLAFMALSLLPAFFSSWKIEKRKERREEFISLMQSGLAHEVGTALSALQYGAVGLKQNFKILFDAYQTSEPDQNNSTAELTEVHISSMNKVLDSFERIPPESLALMELLLAAGTRGKIGKEQYQMLSVTECIKATLDFYRLIDLRVEELVSFADMSETNFEFSGDMNYFRLALVNLLKNALRSIEKKGEGTVSIMILVENGRNSVIIRDTGSGIPEKLREYLFDGPGNHYNRRKSLHEGMIENWGVGLYFTQKILDSMGIKMECKSQVGKFAEIILRFPTNVNVVSRN